MKLIIWDNNNADNIGNNYISNNNDNLENMIIMIIRMMI